MSKKAPYHSGILVPAIGKRFSGANYEDGRLDFKHPSFDKWRPTIPTGSFHWGRYPDIGYAGVLKVTTAEVLESAPTRFDRIAQSLAQPIYKDWSNRSYVKRVTSALTSTRSWVHPLQAEIFLSTVEQWHRDELENLGSDLLAEELTDNQYEMLKYFCRWWFFPIKSTYGKSSILHAIRHREGWNIFTTPLESSYSGGTPEDGKGVMLEVQQD